MSDYTIVKEFMEGRISTLRSEGDIDHWPTDREEIKTIVKEQAEGLLEFHFCLSADDLEQLYDELTSMYKRYVEMDSEIIFIDDEMLEKMVSKGGSEE